MMTEIRGLNSRTAETLAKNGNASFVYYGEKNFYSTYYNVTLSFLRGRSTRVCVKVQCLHRYVYLLSNFRAMPDSLSSSKTWPSLCASLFWKLWD